MSDMEHFNQYVSDSEMAEISEKQRQIDSELISDRAIGVPALRRLVELCENSSSGQPKTVAYLLASLYNDHTYPFFKPSRLRSLDRDILCDCISVLKMDSCPEMEVHCYFEDGDRRFQSIFRKFGVRSPHADA